MQDLFADAMQQLLSLHCTPAQIRHIEGSGDASALWAALEESGFLDALVGEADDGAGLSLTEIFSIAGQAGRHVIPAPLLQTMVVRGAYAKDCPAGPVTIANSWRRGADGAIACVNVPFGRVAQWVLIDRSDQTLLLPVAAASAVTPAGGHGSLDADLHWPGLPLSAKYLDRAGDWALRGACMTAALIAGALERVFEISVAYANERRQFGKPIGKLQAIQQQLSVMAEQVFAARMAAQIGFDSTSSLPAALRAAVAKERTSTAVPEVCAIAHAVHGAMGFTEEYDLQLFTRRLHEWRMAYGSETFWRARLGAAALQTKDARSLDFVREHIMAH